MVNTPREPAAGEAFPLIDGDSPFVDVPRLLAALRRGWRVWVVTSLVGLLSGLLLSVAVPAPSTATTSMILAHPKSSDASHDMDNDVQLMSSTTVARRAMTRLGLSGSTAEFAASYTPKSVSDSILQLTVTARTDHEAVRRATAIAEAFLEFRREQFIQQARGVLTALTDRGTQLQQQLAGVESGTSTPSVESADSTDAAGLPARQQTLTTELGDVRRRMEDTIDETRAIVQGSTVIDPPSATAPSRIKSLARQVGAALIIGLVLGAGIIIVHETISNRVRRREDVMLALRAPVLVSTGRLTGSLRLHRRQLRGQPTRRSGECADMARVVQHLRSHLTREGVTRQTLLVVSIESDTQAALAVAMAAEKLGHEGRAVHVADFTRRSSVARLLELPLTGTSGSPVTAGNVWVSCAPGEEEAPILSTAAPGGRMRRDHSDVVLAIATLDPAQGADHLSAWASTAVAVVTAGRSTASVLRSAGQLLRRARIELASVVLVGADPRDETVGLLDRSPGASAVEASHVRWVNP